MISKRFALITGGGLIFTLLSYILGDVQMMVTSMIILFLPAMTLAMFLKPAVNVRRKVDTDRVFEGESLNVNIHIDIKRPGLGTVEVYDELPKEFKLVGGNNHIFLHSNYRGNVDMGYTVECPLRGRYILGPTVVRFADPFTFYYDYNILKIPTEITVYPRGEKIDYGSFRALVELMPYGGGIMRKPGSGKEFHHIRKYQPSDPFRNINWKVYAKLRRLMVNEYEKEDIQYTYLFLDAREISGVGTEGKNPLEDMIRGVLGFSEEALKAGNIVVVYIIGDDVDTIQIQRGKNDLTELLEKLVDVYPQGKMRFIEAYRRIEPDMKRRGDVVIFHTLLEDMTVSEAVELMIARGMKTTVITPVPWEYLQDYGGSEDIRLMLKMRTACVENLNSLGAMVVPWKAGENLNDAITRGGVFSG